METDQVLERGREAFGARSWQDAYEALLEADATGPLEPIDLERLATAAYLTGHDAESTDAWGRAHQRWQDDGDQQRSVQCAFWLGFGLVQRGDMAQGGGWLARAGRMVEEHELDTVQRGYLLVPAGLMAMGAGEPDVALERFDQAQSIARTFGDPDLATLGRLGRGEALLRKGQTAEGLRLFDEAMVAVTTGETSPMISGLVYCAVIEGCRRADRSTATSRHQRAMRYPSPKVSGEVDTGHSTTSPQPRSKSPTTFTALSPTRHEKPTQRAHVKPRPIQSGAARGFQPARAVVSPFA